MDFEKRLTSKLYEARDLEGKPNEELFRAVHFFEDGLQGFNEFVGIEPFGSKTKGYGDHTSDIDLCIWVDLGVNDIIEDAEQVAKISNKFSEKVFGLKEEFSLRTGEKLHIIYFYVNKEHNRKRIQHYLKADEVDAKVVGSLFRIVSGKKIQEYRDDAVNELRKMSEEDQNYLISLMAEALVEDEWIKLSKARLRTGEPISSLSLDKKRKEMWIKRISSFVKEEDKP